MDRQEQVQKLAKVASISVAYAEDLYDSFFPKPVIPQYVADWYEEHKNNLASDMYCLIRYWETKERTSDFYKWFDDTKNEAIQTLVNMHQFGYEVEKEPRYMVRFKGLYSEDVYLSTNSFRNFWDIADTEADYTNVTHTRKELEANGFGWVFDCPGVEVKEVE